MIAALQIPILELEGFEADDVLATLAQLTHDAGGECYLVTGDKDCRQLITDRVVVYNVRKDLMYDAGALAADWGIRPDQVVDYQAIVGDSVDNVPGIPLIGPKIARELLNKYDTLEGIFEHAGEIAGTKRRENVINGREQALLSRQLVRLDTNTPIAIDWSAAQRRPLNPDRALRCARALAFIALPSNCVPDNRPARRKPGAVTTKPSTPRRNSPPGCRNYHRDHAWP